MSEYKRIIYLNQKGVDTVREVAKALPGYKNDLERIEEELQKKMDEYGDGLGIKKEKYYTDMVNLLAAEIDSIRGYIEGVAENMNKTADRMQAFIDSHGNGGGNSGQTGGTASSLRTTIVTDEDTKKNG